ncbi:cobalamin biosynthesis protein CbiG [Cylindrospermum stagnale PCC 7417]|uniref:Cobalamin biosynthesis protein CbiG n=1 Tax=Cylindrospermum stagnale PCC 7417 TaxID=56107 RepID=K9X5M2_9NOST|nr:cobalamin biosynthesis protein [Cylindrospermum stagnale]AFZ27955.1 cobalamin biosynthesis protein CbiG [Cylindrospermum stagnale PCC 7417]
MNEQILQLPLEPRLLWVGIGCQRGTSRQLIEKAIEQVFEEYQLVHSAMAKRPLEAIAGIATIDSKASEAGLVELCHLYNLPLKTFSAEILSAVWVPNPAKIIEKTVGTPSVAEAAAILAASRLIPLESSFVGKTIEGLELILVPKQIFRLPGQAGVVTIAVAQSTNQVACNISTSL